MLVSSPRIESSVAQELHDPLGDVSSPTARDPYSVQILNGAAVPHANEPRRHRTDSVRKALFIDELRRCGVATRAARLASSHSAGSCIQSFRDERLRDREFDARWIAALIISQRLAA